MAKRKPKSTAAPKAPAGFRDRIKELRRVRAGDLVANPANWRLHGDKQVNAMKGILEEIGYADAVLARENAEGQLELVDGHLRQSLDPEQIIPVLILDLDQDEAKKLLAVLDPLASMAETNKEALALLLKEIDTESEVLQTMLGELAVENGIVETMPPEADGKEYGESIADTVKMQKCPKCGHEFSI